MSEATEWVRLEEVGNLAILTLNRPDRGNAFTGPMFDVLTDHLERLGRAGRHSVLLLRGAGPDFCVGRERPSAPPTTRPNAAQVRAELAKIQVTNEALMAFPGISIAAVQGRALGAGCSLAGRCDIALVAADAHLAFPEIQTALPPTIVMAYYGKVLPRKAFFELIVTGRQFSPEEAQRIGLMTRVVAPDRLEAEARALADRLLRLDAESLRVCKDFARRLDHMEHQDAADYGINILGNLLSSR